MIDEWVLSSQLPAIKKLTTYIRRAHKNTTPTPDEQKPVMKAVVGGSAADIIKAMQQEKQRTLAIKTNKSINRSLYMGNYL